MKLGIFTDAHYSSQEVTCSKRYNSRSLEKISNAYRFFEQEGCDLVVCLGDLIDKEDSHQKETDNLGEVAKIIRSGSLKTVCVMGNHDAFAFTAEEFYNILGISAPDVIEIEGKTLIFIDACYFKNGEHYAPGDSDWTDTFYPHTDRLKVLLEKVTGDAFIFIHQNIDPDVSDDHRLFNSDEINGIIASSGKVRVVFQGHYHPGHSSSHNGIRYVTFPAMCENEDAVFVEEI